jgi:hypothetical protein
LTPDRSERAFEINSPSTSAESVATTAMDTETKFLSGEKTLPSRLTDERPCQDYKEDDKS